MSSLLRAAFCLAQAGRRLGAMGSKRETAPYLNRFDYIEKTTDCGLERCEGRGCLHDGLQARSESSRPGCGNKKVFEVLAHRDMM